MIFLVKVVNHCISPMVRKGDGSSQQGAPTLLQTLLDGFIWRSRRSVHGMRRVNYYIKYLIQASIPHDALEFWIF